MAVSTHGTGETMRATGPSAASVRCAARRNGSSATCRSSSATSSCERSVKIRSSLTTEASSTLSQYW